MSGPVWLAVALRPLWQVLTRIPGTYLPGDRGRLGRGSSLPDDPATTEIGGYPQTRASASTTTIKVTAGLIGAPCRSLLMR